MSGFCCLFPTTYSSFILGWRNRLRHLQTQPWHKPVHHTVEQKPKCQECAAHCANTSTTSNPQNAALLKRRHSQVPLHPRGCYSRLTQRPCFQYPVRFHWAIQAAETKLWSRQHEALYKKYILKQSHSFWLLNWDFQAFFTFIQRGAGGLGWRFHGHSTRGQYDRLRNYLLYPGHHTETERARGPPERLQNI